MTKDEIIRMAIESGAKFDDAWGIAYNCGTATFERFAALVQAHTQEQCAKVCDEKAKRNFPWASENSDKYHAQADWAELCAAAIRAMK